MQSVENHRCDSLYTRFFQEAARFLDSTVEPDVPKNESDLKLLQPPTVAQTSGDQISAVKKEGEAEKEKEKNKVEFKGLHKFCMFLIGQFAVTGVLHISDVQSICPLLLSFIMIDVLYGLAATATSIALLSGVLLLPLFFDPEIETQPARDHWNLVAPLFTLAWAYSWLLFGLDDTNCKIKKTTLKPFFLLCALFSFVLAFFLTFVRPSPIAFLVLDVGFLSVLVWIMFRNSLPCTSPDKEYYLILLGFCSAWVNITCFNSSVSKDLDTSNPSFVFNAVLLIITVIALPFKRVPNCVKSKLCIQWMFGVFCVFALLCFAGFVWTKFVSVSPTSTTQVQTHTSVCYHLEANQVPNRFSESELKNWIHIFFNLTRHFQVHSTLVLPSSQSDD